MTLKEILNQTFKCNIKNFNKFIFNRNEFQHFCSLFYQLSNNKFNLLYSKIDDVYLVVLYLKPNTADIPFDLSVCGSSK
jgi:hypothetical protein